MENPYEPPRTPTRRVARGHPQIKKLVWKIVLWSFVVLSAFFVFVIVVNPFFDAHIILAPVAVGCVVVSLFGLIILVSSYLGWLTDWGDF